MEKKLLGPFTKKSYKKQIKKEFRIEKIIVRNGKVIIILLTVGLIKKMLLYKVSYFPEPHTNKNKIAVKLDLLNYVTRSDFKKTQVTLIHCNLAEKMFYLT